MRFAIRFAAMLANLWAWPSLAGIAWAAGCNGLMSVCLVLAFISAVGMVAVVSEIWSGARH